MYYEYMFLGLWGYLEIFLLVDRNIVIYYNKEPNNRFVNRYKKSFIFIKMYYEYMFLGLWGYLEIFFGCR